MSCVLSGTVLVCSNQVYVTTHICVYDVRCVVSEAEFARIRPTLKQGRVGH